MFVLQAMRGRHLPKTISCHPWSHQGTCPAHPFQATLLWWSRGRNSNTVGPLKGLTLGKQCSSLGARPSGAWSLAFPLQSR